jgi:hypothetical protein
MARLVSELRFVFEKELASPGKSPAYVHCRNNQSPRGEIRGGLFIWGFSNRPAAACQDASSPVVAQASTARRRPNLLFRYPLAGGRERDGTRRGK